MLQKNKKPRFLSRFFWCKETKKNADEARSEVRQKAKSLRKLILQKIALFCGKESKKNADGASGEVIQKIKTLT